MSWLEIGQFRRSFVNLFSVLDFFLFEKSHSLPRVVSNARLRVEPFFRYRSLVIIPIYLNVSVCVHKDCCSMRWKFDLACNFFVYRTKLVGNE